MSKKYVTGSYGTLIEEIEILRETDSTVWFVTHWNGKPKEERAKKDGSYRQYHNSWDAARDYLLRIARIEVERAQAKLQRERSKLGQIESLKHPAAMAAELTEPASQAAEHTEMERVK